MDNNSSLSSNVAILSKLAFDENKDVCQQVANNSNTPNHIIEHLAQEGIQKYGDIPF